MTYRDYLLTPQWNQKRMRCFALAGFKCEACGKNGLDAHHLTYERLFNELPSDLLALCRKCHDFAEKLVASKDVPRSGDTERLRNKTLYLLGLTHGDTFKTKDQHSRDSDKYWKHQKACRDASWDRVCSGEIPDRVEFCKSKKRLLLAIRSLKLAKFPNKKKSS